MFVTTCTCFGIVLVSHTPIIKLYIFEVYWLEPTGLIIAALG